MWKPEPGRPCKECLWLAERKLFDPVTEDSFHRTHKCVWGLPEAGAASAEEPRSSARTAEPPPVLGWKHDSVSPPDRVLALGRGALRR